MRQIGINGVFAVALLASLAACERSPQSPTEVTGPTAGPDIASTPAVGAPAADVALDDVMESTGDYIIGISYPSSAGNYPELAALLKAYAEAARTQLLQAVASRPQDSSAIYDLSLDFTEVLDSPELVAYSADGSSYTGGAHGVPLLERFVWLPDQDERLTAARLIPDAEGWQAVSRQVREQLHAALSQRADADELPPAQRAELVRSAGGMIDEGTTADPENFAQFEPVAGADGKLVALRFVFAPYQVGPYSDGVQTVEIPAAVLLPHVAPQYRRLFQGGAPR
ncbi:MULTISPECIES: hypothetical protein [unclassified Lysobacter]